MDCLYVVKIRTEKGVINMEATRIQALNIDIDKLNKDIEQFPVVYPITEDMHVTHKGVSRMVMIDRYSFKDTKKETLSEGDLVVLTDRKSTRLNSSHVAISYAVF